MKKTLDLVGKH